MVSAPGPRPWPPGHSPLQPPLEAPAPPPPHLEGSLGGLQLGEGGGHSLGLLELLLVGPEHLLGALRAADHQTDGLEPAGRGGSALRLAPVPAQQSHRTPAVTGARKMNRGLGERVAGVLGDPGTRQLRLSPGDSCAVQGKPWALGEALSLPGPKLGKGGHHVPHGDVSDLSAFVQKERVTLGRAIYNTDVREGPRALGASPSGRGGRSAGETEGRCSEPHATLPGFRAP